MAGRRRRGERSGAADRAAWTVLPRVGRPRAGGGGRCRPDLGRAQVLGPGRAFV